MTTLRDKLIDGAKGGAAETIRFTPDTARTAGADGLVGPVPVPATIDPTTGLFTTPELVPGPYVVRIKWRSIALAEEYRIAVPDTGTNIGLSPLIAAFVALPPDTPMELLAKYFAENPVNVGGLTKEEADQSYAPLWQPNTAYALGALAISPTTGQIGTAKAAFTSGATYNAANWNLASGSSSGAGLVDDGTGLFTISSGSSITEDSSNPGLYLIGA